MQNKPPPHRGRRFEFTQTRRHVDNNIIIISRFYFCKYHIAIMSTAIKPTWKKLLQSSLQENIAKVGTSATYASIATVKKDNTPAVRTVVMRGFVAEHHTEETGWDSDLLVVITDKTSDKVEEIRNNPHTEVNW